MGWKVFRPLTEEEEVVLQLQKLNMLNRLRNLMVILRMCSTTKFPFKRKVLPSHPSYNHLRQRIELGLNFYFPMHWDWLKWFQFWKMLKVLTLLNLLPRLCKLSISLWLLKSFPNTLGKSSNRPPGSFIILAKLSNVQKIPECLEYVRSEYSNYHFNRSINTVSIARKDGYPYSVKSLVIIPFIWLKTGK